jgi:hypothetical protein
MFLAASAERFRLTRRDDAAFFAPTHEAVVRADSVLAWSLGRPVSRVDEIDAHIAADEVKREVRTN